MPQIYIFEKLKGYSLSLLLKNKQKPPKMNHTCDSYTVAFHGCFSYRVFLCSAHGEDLPKAHQTG